MGICFTRRTEAVILRLESTHDTLAERVKLYDLEIDKCQACLSDPRNSRSEKLSSLRRQKVFVLFRERAQNRMVVLLQKICAVEELESTREEIQVYRQVSKLFRNSPSVEKVEAMCSRLDQLTDDLCEISELLEVPEIDVSADLEALEAEAERDLTLPEVPDHPLVSPGSGQPLPV